MKKCSVIGLGYIGLPTAATLASRGLIVEGIDINEEIVRKINLGEVHILEPDLEKLVENMIMEGRLSASVSLAKSDIFIIAVPTPFKNSKSNIPEPDISYVIDAANSIGTVLEEDNLVVIESTCPVGTTDEVIKRLCEVSNLKADDFQIAYSLLTGYLLCS